MADRNVENGDQLRNLVQGLVNSNDFQVMLAETLRMVMDAEVENLCGAGYGARSDERKTSRNGYRQRALETRLGTVDLSIPKVRQGSYFPSFLEPRRRWEQAFVNVV
jgi:putative transposase